jgi:NDP-sugar pyrophosphorylase family protein
VSGINSRSELAELERIVRQKKLKQLMQDGVTIIDPASTYVEPSVQIGADSVLYPNVFLEKGTVIGANCQIYPNVRITASTIEDGVVVLDSCLISESHIRRSKSGLCSFEESHRHRKPGPRCLSRSELATRRQTKAAISLGDAEIGQDVNVGAEPSPATMTREQEQDNYRRRRIRRGDSQSSRLSRFTAARTLLRVPPFIRMSRRRACHCAVTRSTRNTGLGKKNPA